MAWEEAIAIKHQDYEYINSDRFSAKVLHVLAIYTEQPKTTAFDILHALPVLDRGEHRGQHQLQPVRSFH